MENIVMLVILPVIYVILKKIFDVNLEKIKKIGENPELDKIAQKYPENKEICKVILKKLNNENVIIEENEDSGATVYLIINNKILLSKIKSSFTRIQTIAHECLHSIQDKKLLWFNFIFSNIYIMYFGLICILSILKIINDSMLFGVILVLFGLIFYSVRMYLENDAMIKARYLAKEYMEEKNILESKDIEKIINEYDKLNNLGIKCVNFQIFSSVIIKTFIFFAIQTIMTIAF